MSLTAELQACPWTKPSFHTIFSAGQSFGASEIGHGRGTCSSASRRGLNIDLKGPWAAVHIKGRGERPATGIRCGWRNKPTAWHTHTLYNRQQQSKQDCFQKTLGMIQMSYYCVKSIWRPSLWTLYSLMIEKRKLTHVSSDLSTSSCSGLGINWHTGHVKVCSQMRVNVSHTSPPGTPGTL